ncbi:MAG: AIPR family protein, partial [Flavobacteriaceae bacterium]
SLGNTPVNKAIAKSISDTQEHKNFSLYHNGITLICNWAEYSAENEILRVRDYVVVNGAQSITTFFHNAPKLSDDLRVFLKVISLKSDDLSRKITVNSNNQNSIKPRDLRSNHDIMLRLRAEFSQSNCGYEFEIKRGQPNDSGLPVISNEDAGRELLAFDLNEPYSCHQIYRVFDDKYAEIFGRREVTFGRILFLRQLMELTATALSELENRPIASYALTKYLLLNCIGHVIRLFVSGRKFLADSDLMNAEDARGRVLGVCEPIIRDMIVDLNYELRSVGPAFDYKKEFKSPEAVNDWRLRLLRTYEKDFKRGKTPGLGEIISREVASAN